MPNKRTGHVPWSPWDFDYAVSDSEGLCLLNGSFLGVRIFGKLSLPVIRVKYLLDDGVLGFTNDPPFLNMGAGPYADQIHWVLEGDHGLQKISNRGNEYVGIHEFEINNVHWLEISVYARIGAYHINQQWHLSHLGTILPRVWSKGLHTNVDHTHHPYWRLDFDIEEEGNNRVLVEDNGKWFFYPKEANDAKHRYRNARWFVRNERTGSGAWIIPGPNDGHPDGFSKIDAAVRLYHPSEETNPWPFGIGGLGFLDGEPTGNSDVVFWYIAHLFHRASEGGDHWHWAGPTINVQLR
jgi:hypothetical protein